MEEAGPNDIYVVVLHALASLRHRLLVESNQEVHILIRRAVVVLEDLVNSPRDWKPTRDSIVCSCGSKNVVSQAEGLEAGRYLCLDCGFECIADLSSGRLQWVDPAVVKN